MEKVAQCFRSIDQDGDGVISKEELEAILTKAIPDFSQDKVAELLQAADLDQDGILNYEEFLAWMFTGEWPDEECFALSIQLYDRADINFSGFISVDEIMNTRQHLCEHLGLGDFSSEEVRRELRLHDNEEAGVEVLHLAEWSSVFKPICKEVGAKRFKAAVRQEMMNPLTDYPRIVVGPVVGKVTESTARILMEPDRDVTITCTITVEGESEPAATLEVALERGRPGIAKFADLVPGTKYTVSFDGARLHTDSCSFRTLPEGGFSLDRGDKPHFAIASCNKVYTSRQLPRGCPNDLWRDLENRIRGGETFDYMFHLGDNVYNDHEWYLVEKGKKKLEGFSCKWGVALNWLKTLPRDEWDSKRPDIAELFRSAYRETWGHPPTRYVLANVPNLMIFDDHDIRDDFGDRKQDLDPESLDRWLADIAYEIIKEYQKQLYEDLDGMSNFDYHHHAFGDVGVCFVDVRGCKTFHHIEGDPSPFLGKVQWRALEDHMTEKQGNFASCKVMLMLMPVPIAYVAETATMIAGRTVVDDLLGQWSASLHLPEVPRFLRLCSQWRKAKPDRQVVIVGGDVHEGGWTDIFTEDKKECIRQLTTSAIANKMTKPHEALAVTLTRSLASAYDGRRLAGDWKMTHYDWSNFRNYAIMDCLPGRAEGGRSVVQARLVASDGKKLSTLKAHDTDERLREGQVADLAKDAATHVFNGLKASVPKFW